MKKTLFLLIITLLANFALLPGIAIGASEARCHKFYEYGGKVAEEKAVIFHCSSAGGVSHWVADLVTGVHPWANDCNLDTQIILPDSKISLDDGCAEVCNTRDCTKCSDADFNAQPKTCPKNTFYSTLK